MPNKITSKHINEFQAIVWNYFMRSGRDLPWRKSDSTGNYDPYHIMVSEIMLQQTQVNRVASKFEKFIHQFPSIQMLASAQLAEVLAAWSGLGYNRRAKFLHEAAKLIVSMHKAKVLKSLEELVKLPGIGTNTAAAILAYSFNTPVVFIETNIRTVYIHHFFNNLFLISDSQILPLVEQTLDSTNPRNWYWALMDYGSFLKKTTLNPSRQSKGYKHQSKFEGSKRQLRGSILKQLILRPVASTILEKNNPDPRLKKVLEELTNEGLIHCKQRTYYLGR